MKLSNDVLRLPQRLSQMSLYKKLLCINQRVFVLSIAVAETAASHFVLFLFCLAAIQETKISQLLLDYGLDQMEREEFYETPKFHGHSIDEIRFNNARKLVNFRLISMYIALAYVAIYAMCTLCLLVGALKRRAELMLPWLIAHAIGYFLIAAGIFAIYFVCNRFRYLFSMDNIWFISFAFICLLSDMFMWYVVHNYYETLKMMKRFTEEAVVSIPCPAVPINFRKQNLYLGSNGYKHLISEISNPNYIF